MKHEDETEEKELDTMDREKALMDLRILSENDDAEVAHIQADSVLCDLLSELGYGDVVGEWQKIGKWYA